MQKAQSQVYDSPVCMVISIETLRVICSSGTENVGEIDGIW